MTALAIDTARRIISRLKAGTTPIDCVEHLNVGNEQWYNAASELLNEIQEDKDALVRFVNGYYGDGKTHFLGMLRSIAFNKGWTVSYLTAEDTPFNKFDVVYSELVKNLVLPPSIQLLDWIAFENKGASALLGAVFTRLYLEANRLPERSGLQKQRVLEALRFKALEIATMPQVSEYVGMAVKAYVEATILGDKAKCHAICAWLGGADSCPEAGLKRRIDQRFSRDASRSISVLAHRAGAGGVLLLFDEAERIMEQSRLVRNKSYGIIRDLLDNADGQGGMQSSILYVAATPEMFTSEKGFPEYDALRSRLVSSSRFAISGFIDWRGVIVDLTKTPLPHDHLLRLGHRVVAIHSIARNWAPENWFVDELVNSLVAAVESSGFGVSKPRLLASCMANVLEIVEQNRKCNLSDLIKSTVETVGKSLLLRPEGKTWR